MKMSIGVDLHKSQFTVCFLSEDRKLAESGLYPTTERGYEEFLKKAHALVEEGYDVTAAVESTGNARYFRNTALTAGIEVKVVNTSKFKVVTESVKKTDKHDARTLAEFLEKDMLPEARLCSQRSEDIRRILKSRAIVVKALVSLKNQVNSLLLGYGILTKRGQLQSKLERQRILNGLEDHALYGNAARAVVPLLETIDQLYAQVNKLEKVLAQEVAADEDIELLESIPGVGLITAATIRAYTDDINRYSNAKKYAAHAGLAPWVQNSNTTQHYGHITKRGPAELRTAFVQMVVGMARLREKTAGFRFMSKYRAMKPHKGTGVSIIAIARKMSTLVYTMLKMKEPFNPLKMARSNESSKMREVLSHSPMAG